MSRQICRVLLALVLVHVTFSLEMPINEDFYDLNPCQLNYDNNNPSGYCYCNPDGDTNDLSTVETLKCGFQRNPSHREWAAIARLHRAFDVEFVNRPALALTEMPPPYVFTGITGLIYLTIKSTGVHTVPSWAFGNSTSLSEIDLHDNTIHTLMPNAFANLINLTVVKLNDNNMTEINRQVFVNLPKVRELLLMNNGIQIVHDNAFQDLKNLKDLSLRDNRVSVITRETFYGLEGLANLDLHGNIIEYIGDHVFAEMPRLQDLDLSENQIMEISPTAFVGLNKLRRLNLRDNKIVEIKPATFAHLSQLFFLDLKDNELESLTEDVVKPIYKNLKNNNMQLYLKGNRFMCNCHILWMQNIYNDTESFYVKEHLKSVTCNMFESPVRQDTSPSSTILHADSAASDTDIKVLTEETSTYAFDSEKYILNLTAVDLNCHEVSGVELDNNGRDEPPHKTDGHRQTSQHDAYDTPYSTQHHHHHDTNPKLAHDQNKHKPEWDASNESHQRDHHGMPSEENSADNSGVHRHVASLSEPQATAALEGSDVNQPKRQSTVDQKVDTASMSSKHSDNNSGAGKFGNCDLRILVSIFLGVCITQGILN